MFAYHYKLCETILDRVSMEMRQMRQAVCQIDGQSIVITMVMEINCYLNNMWYQQRWIPGTTTTAEDLNTSFNAYIT